MKGAGSGSPTKPASKAAIAPLVKESAPPAKSSAQETASRPARVGNGARLCRAMIELALNAETPRIVRVFARASTPLSLDWDTSTPWTTRWSQHALAAPYAQSLSTGSRTNSPASTSTTAARKTRGRASGPIPLGLSSDSAIDRFHPVARVSAGRSSLFEFPNFSGKALRRETPGRGSHPAAEWQIFRSAL